MRYFAFLIIWIVSVQFAMAQIPSDQIRDRFENANSEQDFKWILETQVYTSDATEQNSINSYKAVPHSALAQYVFSPYTKYKYFFKGRDELEQCIARQKNLENVFLRLRVQLNIPNFLGYSNYIDGDLEDVKRNIAQANVPVKTKKIIVETIINTKNNYYDLESLLEINLE